MQMELSGACKQQRDVKKKEKQTVKKYINMLAILTWKRNLIAWYLHPSMGDNVIFRGSGKERDSEETCSSPCCAGKAPRGSQYIKSTGLQDHSLVLAGKKKEHHLFQNLQVRQ